MKTNANVIILVLISTIILSCKCKTKTIDYSLENTLPFEIVETTYNSWVGGQPGVRGFHVHLVVDNPNNIKMDSVYFKNMKSILEPIKNTSKEKYIGYFTLPNNKNEITIDIDPKKEYGNKAPNISQKIPFKLEKDEVVISYYLNEKIHFYKISNIRETKDSNSPSKI